MSVCVLQNLEKYRVLWTDFLASCREINRLSVSKIGPEPAKPMISLALVPINIIVKIIIFSKTKGVPIHTGSQYIELLWYWNSKKCRLRLQGAG